MSRNETPRLSSKPLLPVTGWRRRQENWCDWSANLTWDKRDWTQAGRREVSFAQSEREEPPMQPSVRPQIFPICLVRLSLGFIPLIFGLTIISSVPTCVVAEESMTVHYAQGD